MVDLADFSEGFGICNFFLTFSFLLLLFLFVSFLCYLLPSALHSNAFELSCSFSQAQISAEQRDEHNREIKEGSWKTVMWGWEVWWSFWVETKMVLFSSYLSFSAFSPVYLYKDKERKVLAGQKEVKSLAYSQPNPQQRITVCRLFKIILFSTEISFGVISGFNVAKGLNGKVMSSQLCVHTFLHACMQMDTFVLFVLQILSQDHRHFGNRMVKDKHAIESTECEGGLRRFETEREKKSWERKAAQCSNNSNSQLHEKSNISHLRKK